MNNEEWKKLLRKARAHTGCRASDDDDFSTYISTLISTLKFISVLIRLKIVQYCFTQ
jgi:hypothetical protein